MVSRMDSFRRGKALRMAAGLLLGFYNSGPLPLAAASTQSNASLAVDVRAVGELQAPANLMWTPTGHPTWIRVPVGVRVRLNPGTYADLSVQIPSGFYSEDKTQPTEPDGAVEVSGSPAVVRRYSRSGSYHHWITLTVASLPRPGRYSIPLTMKLISNDLSFEHSIAVSVQVTTPSVLSWVR